MASGHLVSQSRRDPDHAVRKIVGASLVTYCVVAAMLLAMGYAAWTLVKGVPAEIESISNTVVKDG